MSLLGFIFKSKKNMAKKNTKRIRLGRYILTSHAQNRIVDKNRKLKKSDIIDNVYTKPFAEEDIVYDDDGQPSYSRIGKYATTEINPTNNNITTVRRTNKKSAKKYNLKKRGRKYVKKSK